MRIGQIVYYTFIELPGLGLAPTAQLRCQKCYSTGAIQIETNIVCIQVERNSKICSRLFSNKTNVPLHLLSFSLLCLLCSISAQISTYALCWRWWQPRAANDWRYVFKVNLIHVLLLLLLLRLFEWIFPRTLVLFGLTQKFDVSSLCRRPFGFCVQNRATNLKSFNQRQLSSASEKSKWIS